MKKQIILLSILGGCSCVGMQGQSLKDIFSSSNIKDAVQTVTGGQKVSETNLKGTWKYVKPCVKFKGDNTLKNVTGSVAGNAVESKIEEVCKKVGITEGTFSYTFNTDSTFAMNVKGKDFKGNYSLNAEEKTIQMKFTSLGVLKSFSMNATAELGGSTLNLLFTADKFLELAKKLSSLSSSASVKALSATLENYEGMQIGFELKK